MPNAFHRNTSSSAKKNAERERRQNASEGFDEAQELSADVPVSEDAPGKRGAAEQAVQRSERSLLAWNVTVTPSALVTMCVLGVVLLSFTFLSGVIVGRGTIPLPQALELEILAPEKKDAYAEAAEKILTEEELRFMTSLKARETEGVLSAATADKAAKKAERIEKARADRKTERRPEARADRKVEKRAEKKREARPEEKAEKPEAKGGRFDYELRVAAFQDAASAKRLADRLKKEGMRPRQYTARSGGQQWRYVSVLMRGTAADLASLRKRLAALGLRDSMVISKKAVVQKQARPAKRD